MSITIRAGRPGEGKSYTCTADIIQRLEYGQKVYTNWPVITPDKKHSTLVWEPWMTKEVILDATVYIDEAYTDYDSTDKDSVDQDTHTFFATNRHNDVNAVLIAQNVARIAKKIREIAEYQYVRKTTIPLFLWLPYSLAYRWLKSHGYNPLGYPEHYPKPFDPRPLWFTIYIYENEDKAQKGSIADADGVLHYRFDPKTAACYDTHYFRREGSEPYESVTWAEHLIEGKPIPNKPSPRGIKPL